MLWHQYEIFALVSLVLFFDERTQQTNTTSVMAFVAVKDYWDMENKNKLIERFDPLFLADSI